MTTPATPNYSMPRTAPAVMLAASGLRLSATVQPARQPPTSLSLGSCAPVKLVTTQVKVLPVELNCSRPKTAPTASP
ncbi:hypothetical protein ACXR0O_25210 [Verrucomicrobiota bacterium sgz303538]